MFLSLLELRERNVKFNIYQKEEFQSLYASTRILPLYCKIDHCDLYIDIQPLSIKMSLFSEEI